MVAANAVNGGTGNDHAARKFAGGGSRSKIAMVAMSIWKTRLVSTPKLGFLPVDRTLILSKDRTYGPTYIQRKTCTFPHYSNEYASEFKANCTWSLVWIRTARSQVSHL